MKPSRLFAFHLVYVTVILTFLANIARAEDVLKTTEVQTQPSQSAHFIQFANNLLTVNAKNVSLKDLLQEISRQSGLSVVGYGSLDEKITIEFHNLSLDEGMRLILRHHSFALAYAQQTPGERHSTVPGKVWIFSKAEKGYSTKTTVAHGNRRRGSPKVVPPDIRNLQVALMSEDSSEREDAVDALGESWRPEAIEPLRLALEDPDEDVREAAVEALEEIGGDEAAQALAIALEDEDSWVREEAVEALGEIGGDEAAQALAIALRDEDSSIREEAVEALGEIGGETAIDLLKQALADEDESIRETAAEMLAELTAPKPRVHPSIPKLQKVRNTRK